VIDHDEAVEVIEPEPPRGSAVTPKLVIVLVVLALFAGIPAARLLAPRPATQAATGPSLTAVHNDAMADYAAARKAGKPIYVLFHSLS